MNNFKSILWTILGIVIFIAIIKFFIFMLPFVIAIGILSYIVFKWKSAVNRRKIMENLIIIMIKIQMVLKKVV